ncbi:MAG TPA: glycoside hydrolase family 15 protein [Bryobacteraceae bacterium]|jgi:GH15 family glucan-1,4-alpha-glucosidase|nr:glycoside hydrolase family 15 protein [Bryobacteraceae bacterium]
MAGLIEDYALIGNCATCALVGRDGSIDWLALPRADSEACFAALLGSVDHGRWLIEPVEAAPEVKRRYQDGTLVLETEFHTPEGAMVVIDCMDRRAGHTDVLRMVKGLRGRVAVRMELVLRFEYGKVTPWVRRLPDGRLRAIAGANQVVLASGVDTHGSGMKTVAEFEVSEGQEVPFALTWADSYKPTPSSPKVHETIENIAKSWRTWSSHFKGESKYGDAMLRSLITLKALSHADTGGIIAAATTSLPEELGGSRNWDYRYCWLRDSTFTLLALLGAGFHKEAKEWRDWLLRAIAGSPDQMQILYGVAGERRIIESKIPWLPGYGGSKPVREGNAASGQVQTDVYGEVMDLLFQARKNGIAELEASWALEKELLRHLESIWNKPDQGIWEVRGKSRHFTHSKVMAWVAFDRAVRTVEEFQAEGPVDQWRKLRADIHDEVCRSGFNKSLNSFTQYFGGETMDASLLLMPLVGFLPATDKRVLGTVALIEKRLLRDGFVLRYEPNPEVEGVRGSEGVFLACSFWLADNYVYQKRERDARKLFENLLALRNDVGLLSEEYSVENHRMAGNFPQAFSHVALVNTAHNLERDAFTAGQRANRHGGHASAGAGSSGSRQETETGVGSR